MTSSLPVAAQALRKAAAVRRVACVGAIATAAAAFSACDPCSGVASCTEAPRLGISGQIVDRGNPTNADRNEISGANIPEPKPVPGVKVQVTRTGGARMVVSEAEATTDGDGWWHVDMEAREVSGVGVDVVVTPPDGPGYRAAGLHLLTSNVRGMGNVLGRWTRDPFLTAVGEVYDAATGAHVDGARVTATRRAGVEIRPTVNTQSPMVTYGGRFVYDVRPLSDGPLVLDFRVERDGLPTATIDSITVYTQYEWLPPVVNGDLIFRLDSAGHRVKP
ncbi:hypothetical protein tb265_36430 [Gemmatimonadetes bacterium T265]|nr:hypothetical protein tb265_36430 [Gemmatimonadetes bacterium T265]